VIADSSEIAGTMSLSVGDPYGRNDDDELQQELDALCSEQGVNTRCVSVHFIFCFGFSEPLLITLCSQYD
jgi:hypothetical protein